MANIMLQKLRELRDELAKLTDEELADLISEVTVSEEDARQFSRLEKAIMEERWE